MRPPQGPWGLRGRQHHCLRVYGVPPGRRGLLLSCLVMTVAQMGHSRDGAQATWPRTGPLRPARQACAELLPSALAQAKLGREGRPARCPRQRARQADPVTKQRVARSPGRGGKTTTWGREGPGEGAAAEPRPGRLLPVCLRFPARGWVRRPVGRAYPAPQPAQLAALCKSQVLGVQIGQRLDGGRVGLGSGRLRGAKVWK